MNLKDDFKLLSGYGENILLECETGKYYRIYDRNLYEQMNNYLNNDIKNEAIEKKLIDIKTIKTFCENIVPEFDSKSFKINKLSLILTSSCNLRCKYCYAKYGLYNYKTRNNLNKIDADEIISYFTSNFEAINTIQFFGGEPTLCVEVIAYIIKKFEKLLINKKVSSIPKFTIITNGLNIDERLIRLIKEYNISVTFSIDGPQFINDLLRVDSNNNGSYNRVLNNYKKLMANKVSNIGIECTYTNEHLKHDVSLVDLIEFFKYEFGVNIVHIVPVSIPNDNSLSIKNNEDKFYSFVEELVNYTFDELITKKELKGTVLIIQLLENIINNNINYSICPSGNNMFSVSYDKNIYPCFMYTSEEDLSYGKIGDNINDIIKNSYEFNNKFNNKYNVKECKRCIAKSICSSCLGNFKLESNNIKAVSNIYCNMIKIATTIIMLRISSIKANESKWNEFLNLLNG
jgi:uncharacterized protein